MNLVEYVFSAARDRGLWQRPAILCEERSITYEELLSMVRRCAGAIRGLGLGAGERVGIVAADCPEWIAAFLGVVATGAVAVPASTMMTAKQFRYVLGHSGARAVVVTPEQLDKLRAVRNELPGLETVIVIGNMEEDARSFAELLAEAPELEVLPARADSLAFILYTSGSTGEPKGVMHLHRNLPYTVEHCCKEALGVGPEDRLFSSSRLFFAYGLGNSLSFPLASGATSILCREKPTPAIIASVFERHRPTIFFGVPAVFRALIEYKPGGCAIAFDSIKFCVSAGEKLPETIFHEWKALTGLDILDGIGSTEMLQMFITNTRGRVVPGSSGRPVPGYWAKLVDEHGREVSGAGTGHLLIKGGSASPGYWNDPEKTAATMQGEWTRTGDLYRRDGVGDYWFEGRSDDLFKVKGLWVSPVEVEEALLSCRDVVEAAVVPAIDSDGMNVAAAYVVLRSKEESDEAACERLKSEVSSLLPPYKRPSEIHFMEALPRTATGKLQRYKLR